MFQHTPSPEHADSLCADFVKCSDKRISTLLALHDSRRTGRRPLAGGRNYARA